MNIIELQQSETYPKFNRRKRNSAFLDNNKFNESEFFQDILQTPLEKILNILANTLKFLFNSKADEKMIQDLEWVIKKIETNSLYSYDYPLNSPINTNICSDNMKTFVDYLNYYCEQPLTFQSPKLYKTQIVKNVSELECIKKPHRKNSFVTLSKNNIDSIDEDKENILNKDFNIFEYEKKVGRYNVLPSIALIAIKCTKTIDLINCVNISAFLESIRNGYKDVNHYHNDLHAADVCQSALLYLTYNDSQLTEMTHLKKIDLLSLVIASLIHDIGHPGVNNNYLINTRNELANTYNDKSVLENFHVAEGFRIMNSFNILSRLDTGQLKKFRKRVIECVLSTDMVCHMKIYSIMKNKVISKEINNICDPNILINVNSNTFFEEQQDVMNFILHLADISHSSKSFEISKKWTSFIMEEFWNQGDLEKEKGLQVTFLCDRETIDVPRSQIGFIKGIISPSYDILTSIVPSLYFLKENIQKNLEEWQNLVNEKIMIV